MVRPLPPPDHHVLNMRPGWFPTVGGSHINLARTAYLTNNLSIPPRKDSRPLTEGASAQSQLPFERRWGIQDGVADSTPVETGQDPAAAAAARAALKRKLELFAHVRRIFTDRFARTGREVARVIRHFDNGDGRITIDELRQGVQMFLGTALEEDELQAVFDSFDKDQSGAIEIGEFLAELRPKSLGELLNSPTPPGATSSSIAEEVAARQPARDADGMLWPSARDLRLTWGSAMPRLSLTRGPRTEPVPNFDFEAVRVLSPTDPAGFGCIRSKRRRPYHMAVDMWERLPTGVAPDSTPAEPIRFRPKLRDPASQPAPEHIRGGRGFRKKGPGMATPSLYATQCLPATVMGTVQTLPHLIR